MAVFAETKLASNAKEELNVGLPVVVVSTYYLIFYVLQSTDIIFDSILPEWALAAFCEQFKMTRFEAVERIKRQSQYLIDTNDSD